MDKQVAAALRTAVKRSLSALVAALAGSRKAEVVPLVSLELYLDSTHRIELRPSAQVRVAEGTRVSVRAAATK